MKVSILGKIKYGTCNNCNQNDFDHLNPGKVFCLFACLNLVLFPLASVKFVPEKEEEKKCGQIQPSYSYLKIQNFCSIGVLKYKDGPYQPTLIYPPKHLKYFFKYFLKEIIQINRSIWFQILKFSLMIY